MAAFKGLGVRKFQQMVNDILLKYLATPADGQAAAANPACGGSI